MRGSLLWCAPLLFGLLAAVPAAVLSSRAGLGRAARRLGLFLTPEEVAPAPVLRACQRLAAARRRRRAGGRSPVPSLQLASGAAEAG